MKFDYLSQELENQGFKLVGVTLIEDGYEIRIKANDLDRDNYHDTTDFFRKNMKKLEPIDYKGLVVTNFCIGDNICTMLLVPESIDEMTEFIWKYVEKYGKRDKRLSSILSDAYSTLENAIEHIPSEYGHAKAEAERNYDKLSRIIF